MTRAILPTDADLVDLIREHGTYASVARVLGCSPQAVASRAAKLGIKSPDRRGGPRTCDLCGVSSEDKPVLTFSVTGSGGRWKGLGMGSFHACEPCWRRTAGTRMHPRRRKLVAEPLAQPVKAPRKPQES